MQQNKESEGQYKQFLIVRPQVTDEQCHPEEGIYNMVNEEEWKIHMTSDGRIEEDYQLRKVSFQDTIRVLLNTKFTSTKKLFSSYFPPFIFRYFPPDLCLDKDFIRIHLPEIKLPLATATIYMKIRNI